MSSDVNVVTKHCIGLNTPIKLVYVQQFVFHLFIKVICEVIQSFHFQDDEIPLR